MANKIPKLNIVRVDDKGMSVPAAGTLDYGMVLRYDEKGLTNQEIAALCNCKETDVEVFRYRHNMEGNSAAILKNFKEIKGNAFNHKLKTALDYLDVGKLQNMKGRDFSALIETLNKNARLESGESTSNIAMHIFSAVKNVEQASDAAHSKIEEAEVING